MEPVIDDTDSFGSLYGLTRLTIGIGKLVPSQAEPSRPDSIGVFRDKNQDEPAVIDFDVSADLR